MATETAEMETQAAEYEEKTLFAIPQLVGVLRWFEELIAALSGYGIVFALAVGVVDILTDGRFTSQAGWIDFAYAWSMALGIAGQIIGSASRSSRSFNQGHWLRGLAYSILVFALALVEYQSGVLFGFHKAFNTPVTQSLARLGIDQPTFIQVRTAVAVSLAVLSGYLRYQPQKRKTLAQERADVARQIQEAELKNQLMTARAGGLFRSARAVLKSAKGEGEEAAPLV